MLFRKNVTIQDFFVIPILCRKQSSIRTLQSKCNFLEPVLWILGILVRIRVRILLFSSVADKMPTKIKFFFKVYFAYYFLKVHLHKFLQKNSQKEVTNQQKSRIFLIFCLLVQGSGSGRTKNLRIRIHITGQNGTWQQNKFASAQCKLIR